MSGTSCDGVDAALVRVTGRGDAMTAAYVGHVETSFEPEFRRKLLQIRESGGCSFRELAELGRTLTLAYAAATKQLLEQSKTKASDVAAVAAHGQTLFHDPPNTIQWFDPSLLAHETNIAVVSDFRRADCAAGGQGAPLVPFGDWVFFRHPEKTRVILNLGGIANLTYLPAGGGIDEVIAFDTGPGCCISDEIVRQRVPDGPGFDIDGRYSSPGLTTTFSTDFAEKALKHGFFFQPPPKSTDAPEMIRVWQDTLKDFDSRPTLSDELKSAAMFSALAFWDSVRQHLPSPLADGDQVRFAGGGARNPTLLDAIQLTSKLLGYGRGNVDIDFSEFLMPSQAREAACFAVLGAATLDGLPSNVPSATGARRRVVLGSVTPRPA